jgi:hypothetical protein
MARYILEFFYDIYISDNNSFSKKYKSNNGINSDENSKLLEEIAIYPNPAENIINIKILKPVENEIIHFQIKDIFENIKQKGVFKKEFEQININQLNSGICYIHLVLNDKIISTKKFIKK